MQRDILKLNLLLCRERKSMRTVEIRETLTRTFHFLARQSGRRKDMLNDKEDRLELQTRFSSFFTSLQNFKLNVSETQSK